MECKLDCCDGFFVMILCVLSYLLELFLTSFFDWAKSWVAFWLVCTSGSNFYVYSNAEGNSSWVVNYFKRSKPSRESNFSTSIEGAAECDPCDFRLLLSSGSILLSFFSSFITFEDFGDAWGDSSYYLGSLGLGDFELCFLDFDLISIFRMFLLLLILRWC